MEYARSLGIGFWVTASFAVVACGGDTTSGGSTASALTEGGAARADLAANGADRCASACDFQIRCSPPTDCYCPPCPGGCVNSCSCPSKSIDSCIADCRSAITEVLDHDPACEDLLLSVLVCMGGAPCTSVPDCDAKSHALKDCEATHREVGPPPSISDASTSGVSCRLGSGSGAAPSGGPAPPPGTVLCSTGWSGCSDGRTYDITCTAIASGGVSCQCGIDGTIGASFDAPTCTNFTAGDVNARCGWNLI